MQKVAHHAGVAVSTVSKALRNDPSISLERSRKIQMIADRLGYRPNPMVSTLMAQLHSRRRRSDPFSIAWIDLWNEKHKPSVIDNKPLLSGARLRAAELGYQIDVYSAKNFLFSKGSLERILASRGQWGIIIPPVPEAYACFNLELRGLAAVTIGTSLQKPPMHRVSTNHFQGAVLAFQKLQSLGYKKIGLIIGFSMNERVEGKWLGAFLSSQIHRQKKNLIKPLIAEQDEISKIAKWLDRESPDAVLVAENYNWHRIIQLSKKHSKAPPLGWLLLNQHSLSHGVGGLDYRHHFLGSVAVDAVVAQIHRNERGSPKIPQTTLIDPVWICNRT